MLKFPPLKPHKIPENLIYTKTRQIATNKYYESTLFSTKTGKRLCFMHYTPNRRCDLNFEKSLLVMFLNSFCSGHGYGTKMLKFAQSQSKEMGCGGRIHLIADVGLCPNRIPHVFYRKFGMNTGNYKTDKSIDKFVKKNRNATRLDFHNEMMYFPPIKYEHISFIDKLKKFFKG